MARPSVLAGLSVAFACLVLVTVGCGQSELDTSKLESQIKATLAGRTGFPIQSVSCPRNVKAKKGETFGCTVTTGRNERLGVQVTQQNGTGRVSWKLAGPLKR